MLVDKQISKQIYHLLLLIIKYYTIGQVTSESQLTGTDIFVPDSIPTPNPNPNPTSWPWKSK